MQFFILLPNNFKNEPNRCSLRRIAELIFHANLVNMMVWVLVCACVCVSRTTHSTSTVAPVSARRARNVFICILHMPILYIRQSAPSSSPPKFDFTSYNLGRNMDTLLVMYVYVCGSPRTLFATSCCHSSESCTQTRKTVNNRRETTTTATTTS